MNFLLIFLLFFIWRIFDFLIIYLSPIIIPYLGFFPYKDRLLLYKLPNWITALANFDGIYYFSIAKNGYSQFEQAFFPLYPLLIKFFSNLFSNSNYLLIGLIISNVSFLLGLWFFNKYLEIVNIKSKVLTVIFLIIFPTSFFFGSVYTEGLFFLFLILSLFFLKKNNYFFTGLFAILASMTRLIGVFLIIPILFNFIQKSIINNRNHKLKINNFLSLTLNPKCLLLILSPIFGLFIYCFYLFKTAGDPLLFFHVQPVFGPGRSTNLILLPQVYWRYIKIFFTANHNFQYYISLFEFSVFSFVFLVLILDLIKNLSPLKKIKNYDLIGLNLFSFANILLPTFTGSFLSIPRFTLISLSFFIFLSEINNKYLKILFVVIFIIFHILMLGLFRQGYFIS